MKIQKKKCFFLFFFLGGGPVRGRGVRLGGGVQGEWERRIEAFVKIQKKIFFFFFFLGGGSGRGWGRVGLGVRVDVNGEVKFL